MFSEAELIKFIKSLQMLPTHTTLICVEVLDTTNNTKSYYKSITETAKHLKCDVASITINRSKLLHKKYLFNYITIHEYIQKCSFSFIKLNLIYTKYRIIYKS